MSSNNSAIYNLFHGCLVGAAILWVSFTFLFDPGINNAAGHFFADSVYGRARKPFVYRVLMPGAIRIVASAFPESAHRWASGLITYQFNNGDWEKEYALEYAIAVVLVCLSLFAFYVAVRYFCTGLFHGPPVFVDFISLVAVVGLPPFFKYWSYLYDFPTLAFFTLGLALMIRRRWTAFLVLFPFACLNKETTILLALVFFIHFRPSTGRMSRALFVRLLSAQLIVYALIKAGLYLAFKDNPGSMVQMQLTYHNLRLFAPYSLTTFFGWVFLILLVARGWRQSHQFLRDALWVLPVLIAVTMFFGFLDELRDYYEAYPVVLMLLVPGIAQFLGVPLTRRELPVE